MQDIKLPADKYTELLVAERKLREQIPNFDKLEACGEDCTPMRVMIAEELKRIEAIKKNFPQ